MTKWKAAILGAATFMAALNWGGCLGLGNWLNDPNKIYTLVAIGDILD